MIKNDELMNQSAFSRAVQNLAHDLFTFFSLILGFLITYLVIYAINSEDTLKVIFKGISIPVLFNTLISFNISEMVLWIYFLLLFLLILSLNYIFKNMEGKYQNHYPEKFLHFLKIFSEGSLILPLFLMVAFPFLVQSALPIIIYGVLMIEILIPFAITAKLLQTSIENSKNLFFNKKLSLLDLQFIALILLYPLFIYFMIYAHLDIFYSLVHYHFLWNNPDSVIATNWWQMLQPLVSFFEFGNNDLAVFAKNVVTFLNSLIILTILSIFYLVFEQLILRLVGFLIKKWVLPYT